MIKIKVIKAVPPAWYHNQIGEIFYTDGKIIDNRYVRFTEFGVKLRFYFRVEDVEVIEGNK